MLKRIMSRHFCRFFLSHSAEKTLKGNRSVPFFGKFPTVKNFVNEKDGGGSIKNFCRKHFVSVPKKMVEEPSRVSLISGI